MEKRYTVMISTKYIGPTDTKGSRIAARVHGQEIKATLGYLSELSSEENHARAYQVALDKWNYAARMRVNDAGRPWTNKVPSLVLYGESADERGYTYAVDFSE